METTDAANPRTQQIPKELGFLQGEMDGGGADDPNGRSKPPITETTDEEEAEPRSKEKRQKTNAVSGEPPKVSDEGWSGSFVCRSNCVLAWKFSSGFAETEKKMVSVERVMQYMNIPQEELHKNESVEPGWPSEGHIQFQNVTLKYKPSLAAALSDLTFSIRGGNQEISKQAFRYVLFKHSGVNVDRVPYCNVIT